MGPSHPWRPKIVLLTPYYRPVVGGLTTFVAGLEHELVRHGAEVTVLTRDGSEGAGVHHGPTKPAAFVRWCRRIIREIRPDIVHGHGHWYCLAGALSPLDDRSQPASSSPSTLCRTFPWLSGFLSVGFSGGPTSLRSSASIPGRNSSGGSGFQGGRPS